MIVTPAVTRGARARVVVGDGGYDLEQVRLGGAALDVIPVEPPTSEHPAPTWPRLVVTPHVAWYSAEAEEACVTRPVLSVRDVLEGREPGGAVNRP